MSNSTGFPLHLQSTSTEAQPSSIMSSLETGGSPASSHISQGSPLGSTPYIPGSVLSPSSSNGVIQPSPLMRPYQHPVFSPPLTTDSLASSVNIGSGPSHSYTPSAPSPLTNSMISPPLPTAPCNVPTPPPIQAPAPTPPPPTQRTPPPSSVPSSTRKATSSTIGTSSGSSRAEAPPLLSKEKIEQLAKQVDPNLKLDDDVQEFLQQYAEELVDELAGMSAKLAMARKSKVLEVQDVRFYLEHNWNIFIPGFGADPVRAKRKIPETEAHKNRQAIIKKHLKKF